MKKILFSSLTLISLAVQAQIPSNIPTNGLVSWWEFSGNPLDGTGNGNHGALQGATLSTDRNGSPLRAYTFVDDTITVANSGNFALNQFSVSGWINTSSSNQNYCTMFSHYAGTTTVYSGYWIGVLQSKACIYIANNDLGINLVGTSLVNDGYWHSITGTFDGTTAKIYVDGQLESSYALAMSLSPCQTTIGNDHLHELFTGQLDDIGVWNRALLSSEISSIYQNTPLPCIYPYAAGTATNAYTNLNRMTAPVTVNKDLNTVIFAHRNNTNVFGGNSGQFRYDISYNAGNTWTTEIGPVNPLLTWAGRYPQAAIYNPTGNTNPQNAYLNYLGGTFDGTYWNGTVSGSRRLDGTTNTENYNQPAVTGTLIPYSLTEGAPGVYWATELVSDGLNNATGEHRVYKGVWNGTEVQWSENIVFSPAYDFSFYGTSEASVAFAPNGQTGYVCFLADLDVNNTANPQYYPILYKTTNGGASWSGPIEIPLDPFPGISCLNSTFAFPVGSEYSLTVDINGNPHVFLSILSSSNGNYGLYDITSSGNIWYANFISSVNTVTSNPLVDNSTWHLRPEITRSTDGTKIFYTWLDNLSVPAGTPNDLPDFIARGFDVVNNVFTAVVDFTSCNSSCAGQIFFQQVADRVLEPASNTYKIACVYSLLSNADPLQAASFAFLDPVQFSNSDFNIPYAPPSAVVNAAGAVSDTIVCLGDSVYVSGSAVNATSIVWRDQAGNTFNNNSWITSSSTFILTMIASNNQGCSASGGTFNISVLDPSFLAPLSDSIIPASCSISNDGSATLLSGSGVITGTEPFISEYYKGSGNNFAIEIYNPTSAPFDLGNIACSFPSSCYARLTSTSGSYNFAPNSVIPPYSSIVIVNPNASPALLALADFTSPIVDGSTINLWVWIPSFNTGQIFDVSVPTTGQTVRRNLNIGSPNATYTVSEWSSFPLSTNDLGIHSQFAVYNVPGATIQWDVNANSQTGPVANNLRPGTYSYTISYPQLNCSYQGNVTVPSLGLDQFNVSFAATQVLFTSPPFVAQFNNTTPNPGSYNFTWDFGDGNYITSNNPSVFHQYLYNGLYTVTLIAEDIGSGCKDTLIRNGYIYCTGGNNCSVTANIQAPTSTTYCQGDTAFLTCNTNSSYSYQWYNNGSPIPGQTFSVCPVTQSGIYQVYISDAVCTQISNQVLMIFYAAPQPPQISSSGNITSCSGGTVTLSATSGYQAYLWSNGSTNNPITITSSGIFSVAGYDQNGCSATSAPFAVNLSSAQAVPLCYATVDSTSSFTKLIWDRPVSLSIDSFKIYRETMTNIYSLVGSVDYDSLTLFNDYSSNPNVTSYRYKLSAIDTCGNETYLSEFHSTIHLQLLGMGNMQWTLYDIENQSNPVLYYVVYRDDISSGNFQPISGNIPGSNSTFTDINWSSYPNASYRVEVVWGITCVPARIDSSFMITSSSASISNIKSAQLPTDIVNTEELYELKAFPVPAGESVNVQWSYPNVHNLVLRDGAGRIVRTYVVTGHAALLDMSGLESGIYLLYVNENTNAAQKIIKQ